MKIRHKRKIWESCLYFDGVIQNPSYLSSFPQPDYLRAVSDDAYIAASFFRLRAVTHEMRLNGRKRLKNAFKIKRKG
jgi:hypothetical protein